MSKEVCSSQPGAQQAVRSRYWAEDREGSGTQASRSPGLRETECLPLGSFQYDS